MLAEHELYLTEHPITTDVDISSKSFWALPFDERDRSFSRLRSESPVSWHRPLEVPYPHTEAGYWAITRAEDISAVSLNTAVFQSKHGIQYDPYPAGVPKNQSFFITMDRPEHSRYRSLVSAAFTPKAVNAIGGRIEQTATSIIDGLVGADDIDFVEACSSRLPMATVSDIVGVPESLREQVAQAAEYVVSAGAPDGIAPEAQLDFRMRQVMFLFQVGADLAAHRRRHPGDDLMTNLVQAEIEGTRLTDENIGEFMVLISVAGNDTTKQTTTSTALNLYQQAEPRAWLMEDFEGRIMPATEEFIRHATPVMQFARTAVDDTRLGGMDIAAGDKVVIFYCSGNRDESVFERPREFDLRRPRNRHVGFGGGGAHYCLGSGVAKTQLRAVFRELLTRVPDIEFGEPVVLPGNFINGITRLPAHIK